MNSSVQVAHINILLADTYKMVREKKYYKKFIPKYK